MNTQAAQQAELTQFDVTISPGSSTLCNKVVLGFVLHHHSHLNSQLPAGTMVAIPFKLLDGRTFMVEVDPSFTIGQVKAQVEVSPRPCVTARPMPPTLTPPL